MADIQELGILGQIGEGGYGKVYLVEDKNQTSYALKMQRNRIEQAERYILTSTSHNHIVRAIAMWTNSSSFILMEKHAGDLKMLIGLSEEQALHVAHQIGNAIAYLHKIGYIHRDIKPENILVSTNLYVKLSDFGLCQKIGVIASDSLVGTLVYMAPESLFHGLYSPASDWLAFGLVIYYLLTGEDFNLSQTFDSVLDFWRDGTYFLRLCKVKSDALRQYLLKFIIFRPELRSTYCSSLHDLEKTHPMQSCNGLDHETTMNGVFPNVPPPMYMPLQKIQIEMQDKVNLKDDSVFRIEDPKPSVPRKRVFNLYKKSFVSLLVPPTNNFYQTKFNTRRSQ